MIRVFPLTLAAGSILTVGLLHGLVSDRWRLSKEPGASAAKLATSNIGLDLPPNGPPRWHMEQEELDSQTLGMAEIATPYLNRMVHDRQTGEQLRLLLVCGRWGPISVHPPEVCYGGAGFEPVQQDKRTLTVKGINKPAQFSFGQFHRPGTTAGDLEIYWAWSSDGTWLAEPPRWRFPHAPRLFKLYVIRPIAPGEKGENKAIENFLATLLPVLQDRVFSEPQ